MLNSINIPENKWKTKTGIVYQKIEFCFFFGRKPENEKKENEVRNK